jgi:hypothetical protein
MAINKGGKNHRETRPNIKQQTFSEQRTERIAPFLTGPKTTTTAGNDRAGEQNMETGERASREK